MTPVPEPAGDIRAQIAAVLDPSHPKRACFLVPEDAALLNMDALPKGAIAVVREGGTLVTTTANRALALLFDAPNANPDAFEREIAGILGYPEAKPDVVARCRNAPATVARAVQARDAEGHVVHEAYTSPIRFLETVRALEAHVPPGGRLVVLDPAMAIARRVAMRWVES